MKCPKCEQVKEDTVVYCDCGYDFTPDKMKKIVDSQSIWPTFKVILGVVALVLLQLWLVSLPGGGNAGFEMFIYGLIGALVFSRRGK
jgi:hypothetical protein